MDIKKKEEGKKKRCRLFLLRDCTIFSITHMSWLSVHGAWTESFNQVQNRYINMLCLTLHWFKYLGSSFSFFELHSFVQWNISEKWNILLNFAIFTCSIEGLSIERQDFDIFVVGACSKKLATWTPGHTVDGAFVVLVAFEADFRLPHWTFCTVR